jgi:adenylylsulfate kinase
VIVLLAGLPGTGKSTLAAAISARLEIAILDKDVVRAAIFPAPFVEYSAGQDDFCIRLMLQVAEYLLSRRPHLTVFIDGRVFAHTYQIEQVRDAATRMGTPFRLIECVCSEETARRRLEHDVQTGTHPARNRDFSLYQRVRATMDPISEPKLVVDTDRPIEECAGLAVRYLTEAR